MFFTFHLSEWCKRTPTHPAKTLGIILDSSPHIWFSCRPSSLHRCCCLVNPRHHHFPQGTVAGFSLVALCALLPTCNLIFTKLQRSSHLASILQWSSHCTWNEIPIPYTQGWTAPGPEPLVAATVTWKVTTDEKGRRLYLHTEHLPCTPSPSDFPFSPTIPFVELFSFTATFDVHGTLMGHPFPVPLPRSSTNLSKVFVTRTQTAAHRVHCYGHALPHRGARPPRRPLLCFSLPSSSPDAELSPPVALRGFMKDLGARVVCPP